MTMLDPKGLEAAREQPGTNHEAIIRAYIDAIMPMKVSGLVERLRQYEGRSWETTYCYNGVRDEAGTSIENLSIGLATVWRGKLEAEDALASERAAHAETKRERDEAKAEIGKIMMQNFERLADVSAQRDEALKALEPFAAVAEHDIGDDETDDDIFWPISNARYSMSGRLRIGHLRAARRVREGGKANG